LNKEALAHWGAAAPSKKKNAVSAKKSGARASDTQLGDEKFVRNIKGENQRKRLLVKREIDGRQY